MSLELPASPSEPSKDDDLFNEETMQAAERIFEEEKQQIYERQVEEAYDVAREEVERLVDLGVDKIAAEARVDPTGEIHKAYAKLEIQRHNERNRRGADAAFDALHEARREVAMGIADPNERDAELQRVELSIQASQARRDAYRQRFFNK